VVVVTWCAVLDVEHREGGFGDKADLPQVEPDVLQGEEDGLEQEVRAFADGPQCVVDSAVLMLMVEQGLALGFLERVGDLVLGTVVTEVGEDLAETHSARPGSALEARTALESCSRPGRVSRPCAVPGLLPARFPRTLAEYRTRPAPLSATGSPRSRPSCGQCGPLPPARCADQRPARPAP
jgi:hypothetical protein